jgi:hypothetical protein
MSGLPDIGNSMAKSATADLDGGKSGIHIHRSANMDSGLLASLGPGMTNSYSAALRTRASGS